MKKFENFIYTNDEVLSRDECDKIIDVASEKLDDIIADQPQIFTPQEKIYSSDPGSQLSERNDFSFLWSFIFVDYEQVKKIREICNIGLIEYTKKYPAIVSAAPRGMTSPDVKHHIVKSGEGYHAWHAEWDYQPPNDRRFLVWHISLTSHENEGELEFLYFKERITPKAGRLIIWPAFFPWIHRGNAIRGNKNKHYLTGWFYMNQ